MSARQAEPSRERRAGAGGSRERAAWTRQPENSSFSSANGAAPPRPAKLPSRARSARRAEEGAPRDARERRADADAAHAERCEIGRRQPGVGAHQHVDRLRRDGSHDRLDVARGSRTPGANSTSAPGLRVGGEALDRLGQRVGHPVEEALGARRQQHAGAGFVDRAARGAHARHRLADLVQPAGARRVLDREPRDARRDAAPHVLGDALRALGVARLEVGVDRHPRRGGDLGDVVEHVLERQHVDGVGAPARERVARAGRRERLEPERLQRADGAGVPRVRDREAAVARAARGNARRARAARRRSADSCRTAASPLSPEASRAVAAVRAVPRRGRRREGSDHRAVCIR